MPTGRALVGPADPQHILLVIAAPDDLQRYGQTLREPIRNRERAEVEEIRKSGEMRRRRRLVDGLQRHGGGRRRRGQQRIEAGKCSGKAALEGLTLVEIGRASCRERV